VSEPIELADLEAQMRSDFGERDSTIEKMRALRYMEYDPEIPTSLEAEDVRTPVGQQIVERMVGTLTAEDVTYTVPPASETEDALEQASQLERATAAATKQLEAQGDVDVTDRFVETLIADGHGCMKMVYAPQLWRGFPRKAKESDGEYNKRTEEWKRGRPLPIVWQWLDPLTVFPQWDDLGLAGILEVDYRDPLALHPDKWNIEKMDPLELSRVKRGDGQTGKLKFAQLWTRDYVTYALEDTVVHHQKHRYQRPPYAYAFGLGSASNEPHKAGVSCLWPIRNLIPYLDRLLSQQGTAIRMWCWPTPVFKTSGMQAQVLTGEGAPPLRQIEIRPGVPVELYQDEDITFLTWQGNPATIQQQISVVMGMIERAGLSDPMYGNSGGESGYAINQLIAAARMRFKPIVAHAERAIESQICTFYDIVEYQVKQRVYVYGYGKGAGWLSIGPEDLNGYRQVRAKLNPLMPTDEYARASQAINLNRAGLWSVERAMEHTGVQQPDDEYDKILLDKMKSDPNVQGMLVQEAAKRLGLRLQRGNLTPQQIQSAYPQMSPAGQQVVAGAMQAAAPPGHGVGELGMTAPSGNPPQASAPGSGTPMGGMPQSPQAGPPQQVPDAQQAVALVPQIAARLGISPEQFVQQAQQQAQQLGMNVLQYILLLAQKMGLVGGGQPGQMQRNYTPQGPQVEAAPGVRAAPGPPVPNHVGRVVQPSGMAERPSGPQRQGMER
jgi:hypothetical protein